MRYAKTTLERIAAAIAAGAEIHECANWRYTGRREGYARVVKLAQTNCRRSGRPKRIIWACYRGTDQNRGKIG